MRKALWDEFGHAIYEDFGATRQAMEGWLLGEGEEGADEGGDEEAEGNVRAVRAPEKKRRKLLDSKTWERDRALVEAARRLAEAMGEAEFEDFNEFARRAERAADDARLRLSAADRKTILRAMSWRDEAAPCVVRKIAPKGRTADPLRGLFEATVDGKPAVVEYEADAELRDAENVPLLEPGGVEAFIRREVLRYVEDAWIVPDKTQVGYEISFARYFYKPKSMRSLEAIRKEIEDLEKETEGLLEAVLVEVSA